jgi:osmotically-inducible protein OsmY
MVTQARTVHGLPPQSDMETPNRADLEQRVADALSVAGSISPSDVVVVDMEGTIYLRGVVSSLAEVKTAGEIAKSVECVKSVSNEVDVISGNG